MSVIKDSSLLGQIVPSVLQPPGHGADRKCCRRRLRYWMLNKQGGRRRAAGETHAHVPARTILTVLADSLTTDE